MFWVCDLSFAKLLSLYISVTRSLEQQEPWFYEGPNSGWGGVIETSLAWEIGLKFLVEDFRQAPTHFSTLPIPVETSNETDMKRGKKMGEKGFSH